MVSMIIFMMLVEVLLLGVLISEMMLTYGSELDIFILIIGLVGLLFRIHHDSSVMLSSEYFYMMILCLDYLFNIAMTRIIGW